MTPSKTIVAPRPDKPGIIYLARNKVNGKCYVGQTTQGLEARKTGHIKRLKSGSTSAFHLAIRKHGMDNFVFEILQMCCGRECLDLAEIWWIQTIGCLAPNGYNVHEGGRCRIQPDHVRVKISEANKGKKHTWSTKGIARPHCRGKIMSPEARAKVSAALRGRKRPNNNTGKSYDWLRGKKHTEETKQKMSEARIRYWKAKRNKSSGTACNE